MSRRAPNFEGADAAPQPSVLRIFPPIRRRFVRLRRRGARALFILAPLAIAMADAMRRPGLLGHFDTPSLFFYIASVGISGALWASLVVMAARKRGGVRWIAWVVLVVLAGFALGAQSYTYTRYMAYMDHQAVLVGTSMMPSIGQQLWSDRATFAQTILPP